MNDSELSIVVRARNEASKILNQVKDDAAGMSKSLKEGWEDATRSSKMLAVGVLAAGAGVAAFGVSSVKAYQEAENASAQLDAVLASTHGTAGVYKQDLLEQATALQAVTKFSDEAVQGAQAMLLTFTEIKGPILQQATSQTLDMAQALGMDATQAAMQLGKALNDPATGMTKLQRVGVTFTDQQKATAAQMVATGNVAGAQKIILDELSKEFGGSAVAAGKTFDGQMMILKNTFGDLQETVGKMILDALVPLFGWFSNLIQKMNDAGGIVNYLSDLYKQHRGVVVLIAGALTMALIPAIVAAVGAFAGFVAPLLPFIAVGLLIAPMIDKWAQKMGGWGKVLEEAKTVMKDVFGAIQLLITGDFKKGMFDPSITEDSPLIDWLFTVRETIQNVAGYVKSAFVTAWQILGQALAFLMPSLQALWTTISTQLFPALVNLWNTIEPILVPTLKVLAVILGAVLLGAIWLIINVLNVAIGIVSWFANVLSGLINVVSSVVNFIVGYIQFLWTFWSGVFKAIYEVVRIAWDIIATIFAVGISLIMAVVQPIVNVVSAPFQWAADRIRGIWNGITGFFSGIGNAIGGAIGNVYEKITAPFARAFDFIKDLPGKIANAIGNVGNVIRDKLGDWDIPGPLGKVRDVIPGFADGGFTGRGGQYEVAGVVHRGEYVVPKDQVNQSTGQPMMGATNNFYGNITLGDQNAVEAFFARLNRDAELASMGVPT